MTRCHQELQSFSTVLSLANMFCCLKAHIFATCDGSRCPPTGLNFPALVLVLVMDITATRLKRIGKYMLGKVVGQGASGMVRMGRNTSTGGMSDH
jgi:hypothetical protein